MAETEKTKKPKELKSARASGWLAGWLAWLAGWLAAAPSIFTFWQPFNFCIIFFIKTYRFSLFWASVCVGLLAGRLAWLAGFPPGWLAGWLGHRLEAPWKVDFVRRRVTAVLFVRIGCALEGGFCAQARSPGDLRA